METLKAIALRKSTRKFTSDQIPEPALETILGAGCAAPVGRANYAALHLTVVQNTGLLKRISEGTAKLVNASHDPLYNTPTLIVISAMPENIEIQYANASCIADHMLLAATDLSIANIFLWGPAIAIKTDAALKKDLGIPDNFLPLVAVALGYSAAPDDKEKELVTKIELNRV